MSTQTTLDHHIQAFSEGVDSIMGDYTDSSVLFTPDGPLVGLDQLRAFFHGFLTTSPPELLRAMTLVRTDVHGDVAYILWKAEPFIPLATDTFVIRDGKIVSQTFAVFAPSATLPPGWLRLVGPTGGYLLAYPIAAFVTGRLAEKGWDRRYGTSLAAMLVGLAVIYLGGVSWLIVAFQPSIGAALATGLAPFLLLDVLKAGAAAWVLPKTWRLLGRRER